MSVIGFDTSNYTTSISWYNGVEGINLSQLLPVKEGALGLRQSDAVFQHTKSLPELSDRLFSDIPERNITAVGVSTRPRAVDGSYMPCFMVGYSHATLLAKALKVPLIECSHQQGHVAAALWSADRMDLMDTPHLAWHLSGGTTELLLVEPCGTNVQCTKIGGTTDISAGQLIDRAGQLLNLPFPSGKHLDALSSHAQHSDVFKVKCDNLTFSLSGVENKIQRYAADGNSPEETAGYTLRCICHTILKTSQDAMKQYPGLPIVFSGGVASNSMLRNALKSLDPIFAAPQYSTDNAMGVAIIAHRSQGE